jgi:NTP pyrophosphatase (non-canonical NTP hydrolase)
MDFKDYQDLAMRTKNRDIMPALSAAVTALGLAGEAGEAADYIKKVIGHGHTADTGHIAKEIGDVLWYCASLCDEYDLDLQAVAEANISKLRTRYPEGFSSGDSVARVDTKTE